MSKATPQYLKEDQGRLPHKVPAPLLEDIDQKCGKHLPTPRKKVFLELILTMGMDAYENKVKLSDPLIGCEEEDCEERKIHNYMDIKVVNRFSKLLESHSPQPMAKGFLELILNLGIRAYEREYTIYGFKRD